MMVSGYSHKNLLCDPDLTPPNYDSTSSMAGAIAIIVTVRRVGPRIGIPICEIWLSVPVRIERRCVIGFRVAISVRIVRAVVRLRIAIRVSAIAIRRARPLDDVLTRLINHYAVAMCNPTPLGEGAGRR